METQRQQRGKRQRSQREHKVNLESHPFLDRCLAHASLTAQGRGTGPLVLVPVYPSFLKYLFHTEFNFHPLFHPIATPNTNNFLTTLLKLLPNPQDTFKASSHLCQCSSTIMLLFLNCLLLTWWHQHFPKITQSLFLSLLTCYCVRVCCGSGLDLFSSPHYLPK